jgi:hypothetical protein
LGDYSERILSDPVLHGCHTGQYPSGAAQQQRPGLHRSLSVVPQKVQVRIPHHRMDGKRQSLSHFTKWGVVSSAEIANRTANASFDIPRNPWKVHDDVRWQKAPFSAVKDWPATPKGFYVAAHRPIGKRKGDRCERAINSSGTRRPLIFWDLHYPWRGKALQIDQHLLRRWVTGYPVDPAYRADQHGLGLGPLQNREFGRDRYFGFLTLIELFTAYHLRRRGFSMQQLRHFRIELAHRFETEFPFALRSLLASGRKLLKELGDSALLELGTGPNSIWKGPIPFLRKDRFRRCFEPRC